MHYTVKTINGQLALYGRRTKRSVWKFLCTGAFTSEAEILAYWQRLG